MGNDVLLLLVGAGVLTFVIAGFALYIILQASIGLWFHSFVAGARIGMFDIFKMQLKGVSKEEIAHTVHSRIMAAKAGVFIDTGEIDQLRRAGGNVDQVIKAMIIATKAKIPLTFDLARAIDRAGLDVVEAVKMRVNPVVFPTPEISAQAGNGIELKVFCKVTLKANLENFINGAGKEVILARVAEGVGAVIGKAAHHQDIVARPYQVTDMIMRQDKDDDDIPDIYQDTAFEVMSIDVADVNVGENLKAQRDAEQAIANALTAKADAEGERANAIKHEEEMKQKVGAMQVKLTQARGELSRAIAYAISGKEPEPEPARQQGHGPESEHEPHKPEPEKEHEPEKEREPEKEHKPEQETHS